MAQAPNDTGVLPVWRSVVRACAFLAALLSIGQLLMLVLS